MLSPSTQPQHLLSRWFQGQIPAMESYLDTLLSSAPENVLSDYLDRTKLVEASWSPGTWPYVGLVWFICRCCFWFGSVESVQRTSKCNVTSELWVTEYTKLAVGWEAYSACKAVPCYGLSRFLCWNFGSRPGVMWSFRNCGLIQGRIFHGRYWRSSVGS